ncbi:MAG: polymer-forming cytoskeletal protein [Turneriella sp.]|nr:polymer-forming cytoskeletal protein [Spirochaetota bacterium]MBX3721155.1 polymer-forming cytoskeletal protein [Turneriella sp.]
MAERHEGTVISDDMVFRGTVETDHAVTVEGKLSGTLIARGRVAVAANAEVTANVSARELDLEGTLQGNVLHADAVILHPSARLTGDISCAQLEIQRGAKHTGTTVMK